MKYSIVQGIVAHPRIGEDLSQKNLTFYDLGESENVVDIIKGLMKDVLNPNNDANIRHVLEDFLSYRTLDINGSNKNVIKLVEFFDVYEMHYINKTGFNFYLVKREDNKILDVIDVWRCKRESKKAYFRAIRQKSNY
tara:strand:- start:5901 stop:6311 length:411 start_codon:yes stop_codon:yes gene_type:complete